MLSFARKVALHSELFRRGWVHQAVVAPFDARMILVAGDQDKSVPTLVLVEAPRGHAYTGNVPSIINSEGPCEVQSRISWNTRVQGR